MSFTFDEDNGFDVQSTLDIHISHEKSKSLDNINSINDDLNSYPSNSSFKRGDVEYSKIDVGIPSDDYDFIYRRFDKCMGNTPDLLVDFCEDAITKEINLMRDDGVDGTFIETIILPRETMKKLNGMLYYHETKEGTFHPISLDDFIVLMVDELYEIRRDSYEERGNTLSQILEGVDVEQ